MKIADYKRFSIKVKERLETITNHSISNHVLIKDYSSSKKTASYYDNDIEAYMKCTINLHIVGFTISHIRSDKDANRCNGNCKPTVMKYDLKCSVHGY